MTGSSPLDALVERASDADFLDSPGKSIAKAVRSASGPGAVKDLLSGTWLGHALHPLLTDVVIGSWTSASLLDVAGGKNSERAAERLVAIGIAAYGPTALTGLTDWADGEPAGDDVRRVGLVHAAVNLSALALYSASLASRRRGRHGRGAVLALAGAGALTAGGHLGGHLAYRLGVGVDQTAFDAGPDEWTPALPTERLTGADPVSVQVADTPVLLVRDGDRIAAMHDRCSHRGCSLASGEVSGGTVTCACHGSRFDLRSGEVLRGPATAPQPVLEVREQAGQVEVRRPA